MRFEPQAVPDGASRVGHSYITKFWKCPRAFFNEFIRPLVGTDGLVYGRGIQALGTAPPLLTGRLAHIGFATWYESGCRDGEDTGEYNIDLALDATRVQWNRAFEKGEYATGREGADLDWTRLEVMLRSYHDTYGPHGYARDWPTIKVAHDTDGRPIVERELETLLAPGYVYTCRLDLVVWEHGHLKVMEHKTPSAYGVRYYKQEAPTEAQYTGQLWCMRELSPEETTNRVLLNLVVKERGPTSKYAVAEREQCSRTEIELERWRRASLHLLAQIDTHVEGFESELAKGVELEEAADRWFPVHGTRTKECHAYGRDCDFLKLCQMPGLEERVLREFRPRTEFEVAALKELA